MSAANTSVSNTSAASSNNNVIVHEASWILPAQIIGYSKKGEEALHSEFYIALPLAPGAPKTMHSFSDNHHSTSAHIVARCSTKYNFITTAWQSDFRASHQAIRNNFITSGGRTLDSVERVMFRLLYSLHMNQCVAVSAAHLRQREPFTKTRDVATIPETYEPLIVVTSEERQAFDNDIDNVKKALDHAQFSTVAADYQLIDAQSSTSLAFSDRWFKQLDNIDYPGPVARQAKNANYRTYFLNLDRLLTEARRLTGHSEDVSLEIITPKFPAGSISGRAYSWLTAYRSLKNDSEAPSHETSDAGVVSVKKEEEEEEDE
jgi:hypothetical protein